MIRLKFLILPLIIILLGLYSTCYASQPTLEELVNFIDLIKYKQNNNEFYSGIKINGNSTSIATNLLNATTNIDYSINNLVYAPSERVYGQSTTKYYSQGVFVIANLGMGNDSLHFLYTYKLDGNQPYVYLKNQNKTFYPIVYNINGNNIETLNNCNYLYVPSNNFTWSYNNDLDIFTNSFFFTRHKTATIYLQVSNTYYPMLNNYIGVDYNTYYNIVPEPEVPSGEISGDTSGDNIGFIDYTNQLININNSIDNITTQISGDTQKIIYNQNAIAQQQHEDLTSYDEDVADDGVTGLIDNIQNTLSGDLSNSEIFGALEEVESGFFDIITGEATDFIISWSDIRIDSIHDNNNKVLNHSSGSNFSSLNGAINLNTSSNGVIVPAGSINFSKACRENSTLGNIKEKLNIILSALCGLAFVKYLYNLLLATLGIDNPYLYDNDKNPEVSKTYDVNTGVTTYRGYDKSSKTSWTYRSGGGKK